MLAWHFLREDGRLNYPPHTKVKVGKTYTAKGELVMCKNGMHASKRLIDALWYAPRTKKSIICRVELIKPIIEDINKCVARSRKVLAMADCTYVLHEFACRCADDVLKLTKNPDKRSIAAIKAKREWLKGKISDEELKYAAKAAYYATSSYYAASAAEAAEAASYAAAYDAAYHAADAAYHAAYTASYAVARVASKKMEEKQNRRLTAMISTLLK